MQLTNSGHQSCNKKNVIVVQVGSELVKVGILLFTDLMFWLNIVFSATAVPSSGWEVEDGGLFFD